MVDGARGVLNALLADVFVFTDAASGAASGNSPGYGAVLVAETTSGALISAEACATQGEPESLRAPGDDPLVVPEDVGRAAAQLLLDEVSRGGVVDGGHQGLLLLLAALGPEEVSQVRLGPLTPHAVRTLRHIREFFGVMFDLKTENTSGTIILTCVGCGLKNLSRKIT
ncbi:RNA 3'-terminal phosphate cyclase-likeprotein [Monoraphidium neglectum]|uniref:RNA 3'-terminal phosphate cyclase-likeprotein n=1 Tax=Monoraphidium neglectum TaxID=145388 RepID=A0A0D2JB20_9CHLO|nr:RNA 3'-terminal phosphate cyclase-likeprotein [Monoraphidium neglectum]KIY96947.1 RNA 3'-terminal phosphate cyclase-likeprotein [Monoraphidium neglectum]|eukprot:XP_013895967.1 RNA 3'-terminal phosphate cyclase-likeprotein [Monoraphidium neglectum]